MTTPVRFLNHPAIIQEPPAINRHLHSIGFDIGGTSIKSGIVSTQNGQLAGPLLTVPTPKVATPAAVATAICEMVKEHDLSPLAPLPNTPLGIAVPAILHNGVAQSAANISDTWIGLDVDEFMADQLGREVRTINDADAAGLAEVKFGAGQNRKGLVVVITLGTGVGSALVWDGTLIPNTEFGHLQINGQDAEVTTSAVARERNEMSWPAYSEHLNRYLSHLEFLMAPDLIIIGGGISASPEKFLPMLTLKTQVIPAQLRNTAGTVGAAIHMLPVK
ncbi:polyphosphate--glucose phosphotransferase [Arthrobacter psychrochitiniphilus]|uniref:polyphosphate--glucose phosphotransferase n=1 Tax=Arthrobacter psychrochitiniphilus TaxID=291045 RepID=UPI003F7B8CDA